MEKSNARASESVLISHGERCLALARLWVAHEWEEEGSNDSRWQRFYYAADALLRPQTAN